MEEGELALKASGRELWANDSTRKMLHFQRSKIIFKRHNIVKPYMGTCYVYVLSPSLRVNYKALFGRPSAWQTLERLELTLTADRRAHFGATNESMERTGRCKIGPDANLIECQ